MIKRQGRGLILGPAAPHGRYISEPEVLQLPEQADRRVAPRAEIAEEGVLAPSEPSARIAEGQARDQRAKPRLLEPHQGRLNQLLGRGQFGPSVQPLDDHLVERDLIGQESHDQLGRLDRGEHLIGIEHQHPDQLGRVDLQLTDGVRDEAAPAVQLGEDPLVVRLQARTGPGVGPGDLRQVPRRWPRLRVRWPADRWPREGRSAPRPR